MSKIGRSEVNRILEEASRFPDRPYYKNCKPLETSERKQLLLKVVNADDEPKSFIEALWKAFHTWLKGFKEKF
jgi:hypothetical protein